MKLFLPLLFGIVHVQSYNYTSEPPVKLLTAKLFGDLYPTTDSEFRVFSSGEDHEVNLSNYDEANQLPPEQLVLPPGGRAVFNLPMKKDLIYLMVKPGKKETGSGSPFSNKANITLAAAWSEEEEGVSMNCHRSSHDSSAFAHDYCLLDLSPIWDSARDFIMVTVTVPSEEARHAYIWQLHLSPLDDSERVMATFVEEGRQLMRKTHEDDSYNTWLTMVSIVGNTGVGKSTVASLLSGNETMFKAKASSSGTTTIGADISPIIPGDQYRTRMEEVLGQGPLYQPIQPRPLFLIDSEGMSFRGDEVDFVTTGPVAIIANIIVWITTGRLRAPEILEKVEDYMKGLDRITMGDESDEEQQYGEFIIVLNLMQVADQGSSDEEICDELMAWGTSVEDDAIREQMSMRFKEIVCIGLPTMELHEGESVGYSVLERYPRFQEGLVKLGNRILKESETPLDVRVGTETYEMNSTEAETIIGMLIDGANQGNIDLSDFCNVVFSINKQKVIQELGRLTTELQETTEDNCNNTTQTCTACVCDYRNTVVDLTITLINEIISNAIEEAEMLCKDRPDVKESIAEIVEDYVVPWASTNKCKSVERNINPSGRNCDISEMTSSLNQPGQNIQISCDAIFICGTSSIDAKEIYITAEATYVAHNAQIKSADLGKADKGKDGSSPGADGGNGSNGIAASSMTIDSKEMLNGSFDTLLFFSTGQSGGDGGDGADGKEGDIDGISRPSNQYVVDNGVMYQERHVTSDYCTVFICTCHHDEWHYELRVVYDACGGPAGNGGDGGIGGAAGSLIFLGSSGITANNNRQMSRGGRGGKSGLKGLGQNLDKYYRAVIDQYETADCGFLTGGCDYTVHRSLSKGATEDNSYNCYGKEGDDGNDGDDWTP